jgi:hypothetical protein
LTHPVIASLDHPLSASGKRVFIFKKIQTALFAPKAKRGPTIRQLAETSG